MAEPVPVEQLELRRPSTIIVRGGFGGVLMGLANLVPGVSGGTMLLVAGVYPQFIGAVSDVTRFRFSRRALLTLSVIVGAALVAIVSLAGVVSQLVGDHRWIMYSLFVGLTMGGVPVLWRMMRSFDVPTVVSTLAGVGAMVVLAVVARSGETPTDRMMIVLFAAGVGGGAAMILPGVSGSLLILVLGQYRTILEAVDDLRAGAMDGDGAVVRDALGVVVPVGLGVVVGVVGLSHLLKWLLRRHERPTAGVLLGLVLGTAVVLWPFQQSIDPESDWPTAIFTPSAGQVLAALGLAAAGFAVSLLISHLGRDDAGRETPS